MGTEYSVQINTWFESNSNSFDIKLFLPSESLPNISYNNFYLNLFFFSLFAQHLVLSIGEGLSFWLSPKILFHFSTTREVSSHAVPEVCQKNISENLFPFSCPSLFFHKNISHFSTQEMSLLLWNSVLIIIRGNTTHTKGCLPIESTLIKANNPLKKVFLLYSKNNFH